MAKCDRPLDWAASRRGSFSLATTAIVGYAVGGGMAGAAALAYALSVGEAGGILSGCTGFLDY